MRIGFRKPSINKSFKARTTGKLKRKAKKAVNPFYGESGVGFIKDPKKSIQNAVYHKTTFGVSDIVDIATSKHVSNDGDNQQYELKQPLSEEQEAQISELKEKRAHFNTNIITIVWLVFFFPVGLYYMWKKASWNTTIKTIITILISVVVGVAYASA